MNEITSNQKVVQDVTTRLRNNCMEETLIHEFVSFADEFDNTDQSFLHRYNYGR